jgi:DNA-binding XRE family transcriptional regulator
MSATQTKQPKWSEVTFNQIEKRRKELGLSKSAMAQAIGVTNSTFHNWQRGTTVPHSTQQEQIKGILETLTVDAASSAGSTGRGRRRSSSDAPLSGVVSLPGALGGRSERTPGTGENVLGGQHPMLGGFSMAHPMFPASLQSVPGADVPGVATITAAFISSQKEPPSAASVYEFVNGLRRTLAQPATPVPSSPVSSPDAVPSA